MADTHQLEFGNRLNQINRKHRKLADGYVVAVEPDGLIVARPRRKSSHQTLRSLFFCLIIMMVFKGFLYAKSGEQVYQDHVTLLQGGTVVEQVGAYVMYADPITKWIAGQMEGFTK